MLAMQRERRGARRRDALHRVRGDLAVVSGGRLADLRALRHQAHPRGREEGVNESDMEKMNMDLCKDCGDVLGTGTPCGRCTWIAAGKSEEEFEAAERTREIRRAPTASETRIRSGRGGK